jgi:hypothetical protein
MAQRLELPDDILHIIKEYARPVTRPDWRTLHRMTDDTYFDEFVAQYKARCKYINNHPERDNPLYRTILFEYKNIFCMFRMHCIFYQN